MPDSSKASSDLEYWQGQDLSQREDWRFQLSDAFSQEIRGIEPELLANNSADAIFSPELKKLAKESQNIAEAGPGLAIIRGFPVDESLEVVESKFLAFSSLIGEIVAQQPDGAILKHVADVALDLKQKSTRGHQTRDGLPFHSDRCDITSMLCVRPAQSGGDNQVVSSLAVHEHIRVNRPDLLEVLYQPFPQKMRGQQGTIASMPIFSKPGERLVCRYIRRFIDDALDDDSCPPLSSEQMEALTFLESSFQKPGLAINFRLEVGDIVLMNNHSTLHARSAFDAKVDTSDRLMLRVWLSSPLGRLLPESFLALFSAVETGVCRAPRW